MKSNDIADRAESDVMLYGNWNLLSIGNVISQSPSVTLYGVTGAGTSAKCDMSLPARK